MSRKAEGDTGATVRGTGPPDAALHPSDVRAALHLPATHGDSAQRTDMQIFIISWVGQHDKASSIARALDRWRDRVAIVYSDPDPAVEPHASCKKIRRPNDLFWGDKFAACLEASHSDLMVVLHADCDFGDWPQLIERCLHAFKTLPSLGIWAPSILGCEYEIEFTRLGRIDGTTLSLAAHVDALCFAVSRAVVARMQQADYSANKYGWGIGWLMTATAYSRNMLVVADDSLVVRHELGRGYPYDDALGQRNMFMKQFSIQEMIQYSLLEDHVVTRRRQLHAARTGVTPARNRAPAPGSGSSP
jgi:hypothetical protein